MLNIKGNKDMTIENPRRSYNVKRITMNNPEEARKWAEKNNISPKIYNMSIIGYNRITHEIKLENHTLAGEKAYVIERFDRVKTLVFSNLLYSIIEDARNSFSGEIVNVQCNKLDRTFCLSSIRSSEYRPDIMYIVHYIDKYGTQLFKNAIHNGDVREGKLRMSKTEFDGLQPKFNILGLPNMLVDLNTIIAVKDGNVILYTRQKDIRY
jgi:hypothetical protein